MSSRSRFRPRASTVGELGPLDVMLSGGGDGGGPQGERVQQDGELARRRGPLVRAFRHRPREDRPQARRQAGWGLRRLVLMAEERAGQRLVLEGGMACEEEVKGATEAVDVGPDVGGAGSRACSGAMKSGVPSSAPSGVAPSEVWTSSAPAGQSEVGDLDHPIGCEQEVTGLDVPMNEAALVRRVACPPPACKTYSHASRVGNGPRVLDEALQVLAGDVLQGQVETRPGELGVINGHDVGVVQGRRRLRLTADTGQGLLVRRGLVGEQFDGLDAAQLSLSRR